MPNLENSKFILLSPFQRAINLDRPLKWRSTPEAALPILQARRRHSFAFATAVAAPPRHQADDAVAGSAIATTVGYDGGDRAGSNDPGVRLARNQQRVRPLGVGGDDSCWPRPRRVRIGGELQRLCISGASSGYPERTRPRDLRRQSPCSSGASSSG